MSGAVAVLGTAWLLVVGMAGQTPAAQTPAAPCDPRAANCTAAAGEPVEVPPKSTAQQFPFPGEEPAAAAKSPVAAPEAPSSGQNGPAKSGLPAYPGDPDAPAAAPSDSSSSSSSSGSDFDPNADSPETGSAGPLKDAGSSGDTTPVPIVRRKKLLKVNPQTPESRAAEDLTVAEFYQNDGNYAAAYLRAKDAVEIQPDDPYSHFAMAEAARKLGKRDEAKEQYEQVLKLDPIPKQKKASELALAELGAAAKK